MSQYSPRGIAVPPLAPIAYVRYAGSFVMSAARLFAGTWAATITSRARTMPLRVSTSHGSPSVTPVMWVISKIRPPRATRCAASGRRKPLGWNCAWRAMRRAPAVRNGSATSGTNSTGTPARSAAPNSRRSRLMSLARSV